MPREKHEAIFMRCSKHAGAYVMYDQKKWGKCPFCTCQEALNPKINEESLIKNPGRSDQYVNRKSVRDED